MSVLGQLHDMHTLISCDSCDLEGKIWKTFLNFGINLNNFLEIEKYRSIDATTNPSLILAAAKLGKSNDIINEAIEYGLNNFDKTQ